MASAGPPGRMRKYRPAGASPLSGLVHSRADVERAERGHRQWVRDQVHVKAGALDAVHGQADAVHRDRAFRRDEAREFPGHLLGFQ